MFEVEEKSKDELISENGLPGDDKREWEFHSVIEGEGVDCCQMFSVGPIS